MTLAYNTVVGEFNNETIIEKSKFLCYIKGIHDEDDAKSFIQSIKKMHSLANHNCYAYIADDKGLCMKFSDDGEPQGTAGLPMLEVLKNKRLYKTVAVVTRYFGGIKLGTGGLTRAYGGSVLSCLNSCKIVNMQKGVSCTLNSDYENYSKVLKILSADFIGGLTTEFGDKIKLDFSVKIEHLDTLKTSFSDLFRGKADFSVNKEDYFAFGELCQK